MKDSRLQELYAEALAHRPGSGACVPPEDLLALVRKEGPEAHRLEVLDHVMSCGDCHREFELLRALESAGASSQGTSVKSIRRWISPLALAASLLVVVGLGVMVRNRNPGVETTRGAGAGLVLLSPETEVAPSRSVTFIWRPVPGAQRYRLELLDQSGGAVFSQLTADTTLTMLADHLEPGSSYRWWVRDADPGAQVASELRPLRIQRR